MAPKIYEGSTVIESSKKGTEVPNLVAEVLTSQQNDGKLPPRKMVWKNVILFTILHISAVYAVYVSIFHAQWSTIFTGLLFYLIGVFGVTAGCHRLWAHRSYRAKLPLRVFLMFAQTVAFQNHIYEWARDHRVHHKYSETHADPHNATRGFFFSHMGWLLVRKHPEVVAKGKMLDFSDLEKDPVVMIQKRYFLPLGLFCCFTLPAVVPHLMWDESLYTAFLVCSILRYTISLHATWSVNSVAHMFGTRPYDRFINPAQNLLVTVFAGGEGYHNYHHVFPHDYRASEFGWRVNITTLFLDLMALIGQVSDRRKIPDEAVRRRALRTGDPSLLR